MSSRTRLPNFSYRPAVLESLEERRLLATFTVNVAADTGTGNGTTASRSLRQAINAANATTAADTIIFNLPRALLPGGTPAVYAQIRPTSELPAITSPVTIDGGDPTGSGDQSVGLEIDGTLAGPLADGLISGAGSCTFRDLAIVHFSGDGILLYSGDNNVIARCHIGIDADGNVAEGNGGDGIVIGTENNTIGGLNTTDDRNVIGGNGGDGIRIDAPGNVVINTHVGVNWFGTSQVGNGGNGITVHTSNNRIGAANAAQGGVAARNVISSNALDGVHIEKIAFIPIDGTAYEFGPDADNNTVAGNFIGTNKPGEGDFGNGGSGVRIIDAEANTVGSADVLGRNLISGNSARGVTITAISYPDNIIGVSQDNAVLGNYVGLSLSGAALGNSSGGVVLEENQNGRVAFVQNNRVGGTAAGEGNVIGSNTFGGVAVQLNAGSTTIQGNIIGLDPTGTAARPNGEGGVALNNAAGNLVGGPTAAARNVISGNTGDGVRIITSTTSSGTADANTVTNNYIGTNAAGTAAVANTQYGVRIIGGSNNVIGDSRIDTGNAGNVISGNSQGNVAIGVDTTEFTERGTTNLNAVRNNFIGSNAAVTAALGIAAQPAVIVSGTAAVPTAGTSIGGTGTGITAKGNVIVGPNFLASGIDVRTNTATTSILGNRIGTNNAGTAQLGTVGTGINISGSGVTVGSTTLGGGNTIGFAQAYGIHAVAAAASNISIVGNGIGTNPGGTANLGNSIGVYVDTALNTTDFNITIGGTTAAAANRIANNLTGVMLISGAGTEIVGNRIYNNRDLGIDLIGDGVTPNDTGDVDTGPNGLQNFPVLSVVNPGGPTATSVTVTGSIVSGAPSTSTRIDFYAVVTPDANGYGEGDLYLGSANVTTNSSGNASTTQTFSLSGLPNATRVTATATRLSDGSTSEFSLAASVLDTTPPTAVTTAYVVAAASPFLSIGFSENVGASLTASDFVIRNLTPVTPTIVPTANIAVTYDAATNAAKLTFPGYPGGVLPNGRYEVSLAAGSFVDVNGNPNATVYTSSFFVLAGDANRDRVVNFADFLILQTNFNSTTGLFFNGDFDYNGVIDFSDFLVLQTNFNATV